jgi:hypothetical protein
MAGRNHRFLVLAEASNFALTVSARCRSQLTGVSVVCRYVFVQVSMQLLIELLMTVLIKQ